MNYTEIEMEGMKEILRDKEEYIKKLEEENTKLKGLLKEHITTYDVHFDELIEENKKLKSDLSLVIKERDDNIKVNEFFKKTNSELGNVIEGLKEQNKKLKEENSYRSKVFDITPQDEKSVAEETIQDLQEKIRFLEECLDNKEKVNKSLREENKRLSDFLECES